MDFQPLIPIESKVLPGVTYTLKRMSHNRRAKFRLSLAGYHAKLRAIHQERAPLDKEYRDAVERANIAAEPEVRKLVDTGTPRAEAEKQVPLNLGFPDEKFRALSELWQREQELDRDELSPAMIRLCFAGIDGYQIKGAVPDAEALLEDAPPELIDEMARACDWVMGLTAEQQGNLQWPGTSGQAEPRPETTTTAPSAGETASAAVEAAPATPPST